MAKVDSKIQLQEELNKFSAVRNQYKKVIQSHGQLEIQFNENKIVKEELDLLEDDAKTYKLIGPALIKIDLKEAKENVNVRIGYIQDELKRHEKSLETIRDQQEKHREAVMKLEMLQNSQTQNKK